MDMIFDFAVASPEELRAALSVAPSSPERTELELTVTVASDKEIVLKITVDHLNGSLQFSNLLAITPVEMCVAACAVKGVAGPLVECFDKNPTKYLNCLKKKGLSMGADVVKCVISCGAGALAGTSHGP